MPEDREDLVPRHSPGQPTKIPAAIETEIVAALISRRGGLWDLRQLGFPGAPSVFTGSLPDHPVARRSPPLVASARIQLDAHLRALFGTVAVSVHPR